MVKGIHDFALKYLDLYKNPEKTLYERFEEFKEFEKISDQITDAKFLGTAIFFKWRIMTHWMEMASSSSYEKVKIFNLSERSGGFFI